MWKKEYMSRKIPKNQNFRTGDFSLKYALAGLGTQCFHSDLVVKFRRSMEDEYGKQRIQNQTRLYKYWNGIISAHICFTAAKIS
jgi:hypothetical protein